MHDEPIMDVAHLAHLELLTPRPEESSAAHIAMVAIAAMAVSVVGPHISPKCRSMRSASGSRPVKSRKAPTAWKTAMPPPDMVRQPRARA